MILGAVGQVSGDERLDRAVARAVADAHTPSPRCEECWNAIGSMDCRCEVVERPVLRAVS